MFEDKIKRIEIAIESRENLSREQEIQLGHMLDLCVEQIHALDNTEEKP